MIMEMVSVMFVGWVVIICMALMLAVIVSKDEKLSKADFLKMLIISVVMAGLVIAYTVAVMTG